MISNKSNKKFKFKFGLLLERGVKAKYKLNFYQQVSPDIFPVRLIGTQAGGGDV